MIIQTLAPNQFWYRTESTIVFQSYQTIVCTIDIATNKITIAAGQPQSKATAKYLNKFLILHTCFKSYKDVV